MNLVLKKETITKLSDDQMKKLIGGINNATAVNRSCHGQSCNSQYNAGSCGTASCNCKELTT